MTAVFVRILLRYAAAALVARGLLSADMGSMISGDADLQVAIEIATGAVLSAVVEGWHLLARRMGWPT